MDTEEEEPDAPATPLSEEDIKEMNKFYVSFHWLLTRITHFRSLLDTSQPLSADISVKLAMNKVYVAMRRQMLGIPAGLDLNSEVAKERKARFRDRFTLKEAKTWYKMVMDDHNQIAVEMGLYD